MCKFWFRLVHWIDPRPIEHSYACPVSICRSVTIVSRSKTGVLIKMLFRLWTHVGTKNHVLDGVPFPQRGAVLTFEGESSIV